MEVSVAHGLDDVDKRGLQSSCSPLPISVSLALYIHIDYLIISSNIAQPKAVTATMRMRTTIVQSHPQLVSNSKHAPSTHPSPSHIQTYSPVDFSNAYFPYTFRISQMGLDPHTHTHTRKQNILYRRNSTLSGHFDETTPKTRCSRPHCVIIHWN